MSLLEARKMPGHVHSLFVAYALVLPLPAAKLSRSAKPGYTTFAHFIALKLSVTPTSHNRVPIIDKKHYESVPTRCTSYNMSAAPRRSAASCQPRPSAFVAMAGIARNAVDFGV